MKVLIQNFNISKVNTFFFNNFIFPELRTVLKKD